MLHYYAQKFYSRIILSPVVEDNKVVVYYVDDHLVLPQEDRVTEKVDPATEKLSHVTNKADPKKEPKPNPNEVKEDRVLRFQPGKPKLFHQPQKLKRSVGAYPNFTLHIQIFSFAKVDTPLKTWTKLFPKPMDPSTIIFTEDLDLLLNQSNCTKDTCFIFVTVDPENPTLATSGILFLSEFKNLAQKGLKPANVEVVSVVPIYSNFQKAYDVDIKSDAIAPFVWLEARGLNGWFSDNGFLMTGTRAHVTFYSWDDEVDIEDVRANIRVRSLMDMYAN